MKMKIYSVRMIQLSLGMFLSIGLINSPLADENTKSSIATKYYWVEDGKVDASTFIGWSLFHYACVGCHGVGGVGTNWPRI